MRALVTWLLIVVLAHSSFAAERIQGFLTFGCDSYVRPRDVTETWHVNLTAIQRRDLLGMAGYNKDERSFAWTTIYVEVEGVIENTPHEGYLGRHARRFDILRFNTARPLQPGESVEAATGAAGRYEGFFLIGPESIGLVPLQQSDEIWWVVRGRATWDEILRRFQPTPNLTNSRFYNALVVVTGRVGPPGEYGHMSDFSREIAIDSFNYIRAVKPEEMNGTAAVVDLDVPGSAVPAINRCASRSPDAHR